MTTEERIKEVLAFLRETGDYVSGDYIADRIGISRTAVWKYIHQMDQLGYGLAKVKGKGYKLTSTPDRLYPWEIERYRTTTTLGTRIVYREEVDSTNALAFKLALGGEREGTCVIAEQQAKGKGRLGRQWYSPAARNLYMSVILRPPIHPSRVYPITFLSSLAVADTVAALTRETADLKWPNDVLMGGRKLCGTLLEISTEADMVRFVVVGIGLNINVKEEELNDEIRAKATSLLIATKKAYERVEVCGMLLNTLEGYYSLLRREGEVAVCRMWEERARIKGKFLEINQMGERYSGTAEGVDRDGAVLLNMNGTVKRIVAGDVNF
jgi:BirA family biotin operon repressor/biotin-[acetyl-CoA-carboxylase] ligase